MTYEIIRGAEIISRDPPRYHRVANNGFLLPCAESEAQAIVVDSTVYALDPDVPVSGYPDAETVIIRVDPDGGNTDELYTAKETHTVQINDLEESAAEQTIESSMRLDDIEQVLGELLMGGIG